MLFFPGPDHPGSQGTSGWTDYRAFADWRKDSHALGRAECSRVRSRHATQTLKTSRVPISGIV